MRFENLRFILDLVYFLTQKLPVKDTPSLNYLSKCCQIKLTFIEPSTEIGALREDRDGLTTSGQVFELKRL